MITAGIRKLLGEGGGDVVEIFLSELRGEQHWECNYRFLADMSLVIFQTMSDKEFEESLNNHDYKSNPIVEAIGKIYKKEREELSRVKPSRASKLSEVIKMLEG